LPEAIWFELRRHRRVVEAGVVALLGFGGRDVADGFKQSPVVEPIDPFEGGELDGFEGSSGPAPVDVAERVAGRRQPELISYM
jgi:hypothetical protein